MMLQINYLINMTDIDHTKLMSVAQDDDCANDIVYQLQYHAMLRATQLSELIGCKTPTIRKALSRLESRGVIVLAPTKGQAKYYMAVQNDV